MIEQINLNDIKDNPYQPRLHYNQNRVAELAASIKENGLLQVPIARRIDGTVELAFGHMRKRAFLNLAKNDKKVTTMPLDIRDLSQKDMAMFALEENMKRTDVSTIEIARAIDNFITATDTSESEVARRIHMSQGNISNMRRVLSLPEKILEKIEEGKINFTMARGLLILRGLKPYRGQVETDENLMLAAIKLIGQSTYGSSYPVTVDGMNRAIADTVIACFNVVGQAEDWGTHHYYGERCLFDTGQCKKCENLIKINPTKSGVALFCGDQTCWDKNQNEHKERAARQAQEEMEKDIAERIKKAAPISQEIEDVPPVPEETALHAHLRKEFGTSYELLNVEEVFAAIAQICGGVCEEAGSAGCYPHRVVHRGDEYRGEMLVCPKIQHRIHVRLTPGHKFCAACRNRYYCDGTTFHCDDAGKDICEQRVITADQAKEINTRATIPAELIGKDKEVGTRADILDLRELRLGYYPESLKPGYKLLKWGRYGEMDLLDNPMECEERCTKGFHYAYDSSAKSSSSGSLNQVGYVCTDPKCLSRKKAAKTRKENEAGNALKKAEHDAIKKAVELTGEVLDQPRLALIAISLFGNYSYGSYQLNTDLVSRYAQVLKLENKGEDKWIYKNRLTKELPAALLKTSADILSRIIVETCLTRRTYAGNVNEYKIRNKALLDAIGVKIKLPEGVDSKRAYQNITAEG